jgi:hypothetical protein
LANFLFSTHPAELAAAATAAFFLLTRLRAFSFASFKQVPPGRAGEFATDLK